MRGLNRRPLIASKQGESFPDPHPVSTDINIEVWMCQVL